MASKIGFFNKRKSGKGGNVTFTIASRLNGGLNPFVGHISSVEGVADISPQKHEVGMGYWIDVQVKEESFDPAVENIRKHIEALNEGAYRVINWLQETDWSADWLRG